MTIMVPLVPPSGNDYKRPDWKNKRFYVTPEAIRFKEAIAIFARGDTVGGRYFKVDVTVYLGKNGRLDADNCPKVIMDGMQEAGIFNGHPGSKAFTDASVKDLHIYIDRDWNEPRTVIHVEAI